VERCRYCRIGRSEELIARRQNCTLWSNGSPGAAPVAGPSIRRQDHTTRYPAREIPPRYCGFIFCRSAAAAPSNRQGERNLRAPASGAKHPPSVVKRSRIPRVVSQIHRYLSRPSTVVVTVSPSTADSTIDSHRETLDHSGQLLHA